ncbi:MAG: hypothetical protein COV72_06075 [Candidatus Omnitrophica bacterium CG11_big_fil_rev_8_21_14_0_20_42_13]|uniref:Cytoskeleton protein RodZ-like C-terminal domain-containing protein n=1 Tax=Candidatus Ghiorseimicrobium undicola TaxID=1974746 RepID=A0A2H0LWN8_9BACT|nr:MAG: hypothetical protein COV72_06075 [Candidatus Omnitrophica bacterium CG11_big_fil_rev_8_21_14_0_20_42_13]
MEYLGTLLKQTREKKGITLDLAHQATKICKEILIDIESDRISKINPVYLKGYLKIYSKYLNLDAGQILDAYRNIFPSQEKKAAGALASEIRQKQPMALPRLNVGVISAVFIGVVIIFSFSALVKHFGAKNKERPPVEAVADSKALEPKAAANEPAQAGIIEHKKALSADGIKLTIKAKEATYVQVKVDGILVFQRRLKKDYVESWSAKNEIELSLGSAGSVDLEVNGKALPPLGKKKQPIKSMVISKDGSIKIK